MSLWAPSRKSVKAVVPPEHVAGGPEVVGQVWHPTKPLWNERRAVGLRLNGAL